MRRFGTHVRARCHRLGSHNHLDICRSLSPLSQSPHLTVSPSPSLPALVNASPLVRILPSPVSTVPFLRSRDPAVLLPPSLIVPLPPPSPIWGLRRALPLSPNQFPNSTSIEPSNRSLDTRICFPNCILPLNSSRRQLLDRPRPTPTLNSRSDPFLFFRRECSRVSPCTILWVRWRNRE